MAAATFHKEHESQGMIYNIPCPAMAPRSSELSLQPNFWLKQKFFLIYIHQTQDNTCDLYYCAVSLCIKHIGFDNTYVWNSRKFSTVHNNCC